MKKLIVFASLLVSALAAAQGVMTVHGTVRDSKGEPVAGAVVSLEGSTASAALVDMDGNYQLRYSPSGNGPDRLSVSCIGFLGVTEAINGRDRMDFILQEDLQQLDEVVVVGYGAMRRSDLTGSVASVKLDETESAQSTSIDQVLQGRAAGVQVFNNSAAPDAGVSILIRGASSFNGSSEPLYVVDGVIMNVSASSSLMSHSGADNAGTDERTNGLMGINPQDIASIQVLKDASATAIYGSQGANGVVLITTKGANKDKPVIQASAGVDVSIPYKRMPVMSFDEFVVYLENVASSPIVGQYNPSLAIAARSRLNIINSATFHDRYTIADWQDYLMRPSVSQRYYLSVSGKPGNMDYRVSLGCNDTRGIISGTGFRNYTLRVNLDYKLGKIFTIGTRNSLSYLDSQLTQGASTGRLTATTSMMRSMLTTVPYGAIMEYDEDGDVIDYEDDTNQAGPNRWVQGFDNRKVEYRISPSVYIQAKALPWLSFKTLFGADYRVTEQTKFKSQLLTSTAAGSSGAATHIDRINWNWDTTADFNKRFGRYHTLSGTLGMSLSSSASVIQTQEGTNIRQWKALGESLNEAPYGYFSYTQTAATLMSFFARGIYNYRDRYILTATLRADGSSKFAGKNKWGFFPSFAFAWRLSQESWFNVPSISSAKLRLGWGQVGNQAIGSYVTIYKYNTGYYPSHDTVSQTSLITYTSNLPNPDLRWETTDQANVGFDFGMFQGRLSLSVDAYYKKTRDLLQTRILAGSSGMSNPYVNMGAIENKGFEFTLEAVPVKTSDWEWVVGGNLSLNRNKVLSINPEGTDSDWLYLSPGNRQFKSFFYGDKIGSSSVMNARLNIFVEGYPMALFYGIPTDGLVQSGETGLPYSESDASYHGPGSVKYVDVNGDGYITEEDRIIIGDPNPDFTYGFNTSLRYKWFSLSATFVGSFGNDIYNVNRMIDTNTSSVNTNSYSAVVRDAWNPMNPGTWYPVIGGLNSNDIMWASDRYVEDGSYLRIASISLSYNLSLRKKKSVIKGVSFTATAGNPWVWTRYSGWDPDVNSYGTIKKYGADMGSYPGARSFKFDIKCTF